MLPICIDTNASGQKTVAIGDGGNRARLPPMIVNEHLCNIIGVQFCSLAGAVSAANGNEWRVFLDLESTDRYIKTKTVIDNITLDDIFGGDWCGRKDQLFSSTLLRRVGDWPNPLTPSVEEAREESPMKAAIDDDAKVVTEVKRKAPLDRPAMFPGIQYGVLAQHDLTSVSLLQAIAKVGVKGQSVFIDMNASNRYLVGSRADVSFLNVELGGNWANSRDQIALVELLRRVSQHIQAEPSEAAGEALKHQNEEPFYCEHDSIVPGGIGDATGLANETRSVMQFVLGAKIPRSGETGEAAFLGLIDELFVAFREDEWNITRKGWQRIASHIYSSLTAPRIR